MRGLGLILGALTLFVLGGAALPPVATTSPVPRRIHADYDGVATTLHLENFRRGGRRVALPAMETFAGMLRVTADSSLKLGSRVTPLAMLPGDTVLYQYYRGDSLIIHRRSVALADSSFVPAPPYSTTIVFRGCAVIERGGRTSGNKSARPCWTWSFTRGPAPPVITKLERLAIYGVPLVPGGPWARRSLTAAVSDSNQSQFCGYGILSDGRWVEAENTAAVAVCDSIYAVRLRERQA